MNMIFSCLELLPLKANIKLSNNKTKAVLLSRIKGPIANYHLNIWNERILIELRNFFY